MLRSVVVIFLFTLTSGWSGATPVRTRPYGVGKDSNLWKETSKEFGASGIGGVSTHTHKNKSTRYTIHNTTKTNSHVD